MVTSRFAAVCVAAFYSFVGPTLVFAQSAQPEAVDAAVSAGSTPVETAILGQVQSLPLRVPNTQDVALLEWKTTVGGVVASGNTLTYRLPETTFPQVGLVVAYDAIARTPLVRRVILLGTPTVEVRSEPNVMVTVSAADRSFGPASTDAKGIARIRIEVPPGVADVKTFATDSYGNVTEGQLALNPPPFPRLLVVCAPIEEAAYVVEIDERGDLVATPSFQVNVSEAKASAPELTSPGVFRIPLEIHNPTPEWKTVTVTAKDASVADSCSFKVAPPPASEPFKLRGSVAPIEPEFTLFVGANAGLATNFGLLAGPWVSVYGSYPFTSTREGLRVEVAVGYSHSRSEVDTDDGQTLELTVGSVPILLGPRYVLAWGRLHVSAALHAGLSITSQSLVGSLTDQGSTSVPLWFGGDAGVAWWLGRSDIGLNVGYSYAPIKRSDVSGNVAGLRATLHYERGF